MRKLIATTWLIGGCIGATAIVIFLFGCCVLPFHATIHRALPICSHVAGILSGGHDSRTPAAPAQSKIQPTIAKVLPADVVAQTAQQTSERLSLAAHNDQAVRNLCTLGALRVDDDIGLHTLFSTFLI
jgi:apolipoprotein N-acyltransferase